MASKQEILDKIQILITQRFPKPEDAFHFFDKNGDGKLEKNEVKSLLKDASVSGFIRSLVAGKLLDEFDTNADELISWEEFQLAVSKLFPAAEEQEKEGEV